MEAAGRTTAEVETKYTLSEMARSTHGQDGAVVLEIHQGHMFSVNRLGSRVLELLRTAKTESEIANAISGEFEVGRERVEKDLREFLRILAQHKLIKVCGADNAASSYRNCLK